MKIDKEVLDKIKAELAELAGSARLKVKTSCQIESAARVEEYERGGKFGFNCILNPKRIRTQKQLEGHIDWFRQSLTE